MRRGQDISGMSRKSQFPAKWPVSIVRASCATSGHHHQLEFAMRSCGSWIASWASRVWKKCSLGWPVPRLGVRPPCVLCKALLLYGICTLPVLCAVYNHINVKCSNRSTSCPTGRRRFYFEAMADRRRVNGPVGPTLPPIYDGPAPRRKTPERAENATRKICEWTG